MQIHQIETRNHTKAHVLGCVIAEHRRHLGHVVFVISIVIPGGHTTTINTSLRTMKTPRLGVLAVLLDRVYAITINANLHSKFQIDRWSGDRTIAPSRLITCVLRMRSVVYNDVYRHRLCWEKLK